ncbi:hypothetical protein OPT61_g2575 [Boeremia exigua]|uniref:Uncharacterized protein n=1 Tax=Boeremia exigua TaxID=749465 RepID=A0ACC2IL31_9PLEO|nr:hypothetical protein OPT61_g2575 [Boeremia exigua]
MIPIHTAQIASKCQHTIHPSSSPRTPWCPQCIISAAQADLERVHKAFEDEGGIVAPAYMRDHAWNSARLQCSVTKKRVKKTMNNDWLRQERERKWEEAHQQYPAQDGVLPSDSLYRLTCVVCAAREEVDCPYAKPSLSLATAWWEREGALVANEVLVPRTPPSPNKREKCPPEPQLKRPSYLRNFIRSCRDVRAASSGQRRAWEDHWKIDRAVRQKYVLDEDFDMDQEFLTLPLPASHARNHHRQIQDDLNAARRRANRQKRRAEDYKPSRSSLALSELSEDLVLDDTELEKLKLAEGAEKLKRLMRVVATQVGYLYLIGDVGLLDRWKDDVEQSDQSLIYQKQETGMEMEQLDEDHIMSEGEEL